MRASIVIRTLNEAQHLGDLLAMVAKQRLDGLEAEVVLIDSGSTDGTIGIAEAYGAKITTIAKSDFSFGRSLNRGCAFSTGEILVFVSGHCVPVDENWLQNICQPLIDGKVVYSYGRQVGDDTNNFSERRIFAKYFPEQSSIPQEGFFCNNANSALLRSVWEENPFDEALTGLEDMALGKALLQQGFALGYVAEAPVFHHHEESWAQVRRRFEREAIALREIMPEIRLSWWDIARFVAVSTFGDWRAAWQHGATSTNYRDMLRYRWNQFVGSYQGNREHRVLSREAKERFFYPLEPKEAKHNEWLRPMRRPSSNEGQQSACDGKELSKH
jgi:rhamnosyltransferase